MIGRCQRMNSFRPPSSATSSGPGREEQMEGVAEHHLVAERRDVARLERLDRAPRGQRDERGRRDLAVGQVQGSAAGAGGGVADGDRATRRQTLLTRCAYATPMRVRRPGLAAGGRRARRCWPAAEARRRARARRRAFSSARRAAPATPLSGISSPRQQGGDLSRFHASPAQFLPAGPRDAGSPSSHRGRAARRRRLRDGHRAPPAARPNAIPVTASSGFHHPMAHCEV